MKNKICIVMILVLTAIFAVSTYLYLTEYLQDKEQTDEFVSIAQAVEDSGQCSDNKYADLYAKNNDFIGWIRQLKRLTIVMLNLKVSKRQILQKIRLQQIDLQ